MQLQWSIGMFCTLYIQVKSSIKQLSDTLDKFAVNDVHSVLAIDQLGRLPGNVLESLDTSEIRDKFHLTVSLQNTRQISL